MFSYEMLVNAAHRLPRDFCPPSLCMPDIPFASGEDDEKRFLESRAAHHAERLFLAAKAQGLALYGISGFRSYERQKELYRKACLRNDCQTLCDVAEAGCSEHQTGLALDVSCPAVSLNLTEHFGETEEGKWLLRHAPLYGFVLRYPKEKERITGSPWEPWHIRYVTKSLALCLTITGQVLEEYFEVTAPSDAP